MRRFRLALAGMNEISATAIRMLNSGGPPVPRGEIESRGEEQAEGRKQEEQRRTEHGGHPIC